MRLPKSFKQLTIRQYLLLHDILSDSSQPWLDRYILALSALTGKPKEYYYDLPLDELVATVEEFSWISNWQTIPQKLKTIYIIGGRPYKLTATVEKMSGAQFTDWKGFEKMAEGDLLPNIHNLLATVLIPVRLFRRTKYQGDKHAAVAQHLYNRMSMADAYPIMLFFSQSLIKFLVDTPAYLLRQVQEIQTMIDSEMKPSTNTGDGLQQ